MTQTIKLLKANYVADLLQRLVNRRLALRDVQANAKKLCNGLREGMQKSIQEKVMKCKLGDARTVVKRERSGQILQCGVRRQKCFGGME